MTQTMLERAATSVAACLTDAPVRSSFSMADVNGWTEDKSYEIARAVLMAVREPDIDMGEEIMANFADPCWQEDAKYGFTAMIDAILNEPQR